MRVVIGEDEVLLRTGIAHILSNDGFDVLATVGDAFHLEQEVERHRPDLVLTDIRMPPTHTDEGLLAAVRIRRARPNLGVVVVSQHVQRRYATELLEGGGGFGYLLKQRIADVHTFTADLRRVAAGGTALDPEVVSVLVARASRGASAVARLTPRQVEVLELMAQGRSNAAIAAQLVLSEKAVVQHTSRIYDALGLPVDADDHRRVLAVLRHLQAAPPPAT
ncbi:MULTISPECIES: response regulator transcription factor [Microbacterium]|uniref:response regulator transcription factor n=1 Tax=Microbacterium TaxID=33882 RepID=UPI000CB353FE|nr:MULTISPECIES: response regulator transcription factor [Microbacterium]PKQ34567.1 MAG: DNA-binding response regulator [Actinobacteria bacterium HGW-Actinobacteria-11]MCK8468543.1 response regulator transcription factor [Microbacterium aurugineum]MCZ4302318.1 response regulator transcription factor [Microbacterium oxydans]TCJ23570.1 response regulator transcription factor [Microbacterium sp. PI-1]TFB15839.1 response regulator transcription factor [Microbacterium sp. 3H14]